MKLGVSTASPSILRRADGAANIGRNGSNVDADLTTLESGKSATGHGHSIADTTGLQTALNGKTATGHSHAISDTAGLQTALNGKVDDSQVQTNVPAGALFTDNDTVYSHPANHPASIITQDSNNRFVTDVQKASWDAAASGGLTLGAEVSASGSTMSFTGLPAGVRYIELVGGNLLTSSAGTMVCQLGDSGGFETSGYLGQRWRIRQDIVNDGDATTTNGFEIANNLNGGLIAHFVVKFYLVDAAVNAWYMVSEYMSPDQSTEMYLGVNNKYLSGPLDRVNIRVEGPGVYTGGKIHVRYM